MKVSSHQIYNDPLHIVFRSGTSEDPFVDKEDTQKIINNVIVLSEIPDEFTHVLINGYTEVFDQINDRTHFTVNYQNGIVTFFPTEENKSVTAVYKGRGIIQYPASRIYLHNEDSNVLETLQDLADHTEGIVDSIGELNDVVTRAEELKVGLGLSVTSGLEIKNDIESDLHAAAQIQTDLLDVITNSDASKQALNDSITLANDSEASLAESLETLQQAKAVLESSISSGETLKNELNSSVSVGTQLKDALDADISAGNLLIGQLGDQYEAGHILQTEMEAATTNAANAKSDLDSSVSIANSSRQALEDDISLLDEKKTELDHSTANAAAVQTQLEDSLGQANDIKTALEQEGTEADEKISALDAAVQTARQASTDIDGSITDGQNKIQEMDAKIADATNAVQGANAAADHIMDISAKLEVFEAFDQAKIYYPLNKVAYSGSSYVCIQQTAAGIFPSNAAYWQIIAQAGNGSVNSVSDDGSGDLIVTNPNTTPVISVNSGTGPLQLLKLDENGKFSADLMGDGAVQVIVTSSEKALWSAKQDVLGFIPENTANKGTNNGYASLDSNGKIPLAQVPDSAKQQTYVIANEEARNNLTGLVAGDRTYETETGDSYIWDGTEWLLMADADWANVSLDWTNIANRPSFFGMIDVQKSDGTSLGQLLADKNSASYSIKGIEGVTLAAHPEIDLLTVGLDSELQTKLGSISPNANHVTSSANNGNITIDGTEVTVYEHPMGDGSLHVPETGTTNEGKFLKAGDSAGNIEWSGILAGDIIADSDHLFVTDAEKTKWNLKQDSLGYVPENTSTKGSPGGYASLDEEGKVPLNQLPPINNSSSEPAKVMKLTLFMTEEDTVLLDYPYRYNNSMKAIVTGVTILIPDEDIINDGKELKLDKLKEILDVNEQFSLSWFDNTPLGRRVKRTEAIADATGLVSFPDFTYELGYNYCSVYVDGIAFFEGEDEFSFRERDSHSVQLNGNFTGSTVEVEVLTN